MGRLHDLIHHLGDPKIIALERLELILTELKLEIGNTKDEDLRKLLIVWLGQS